MNNSVIIFDSTTKLINPNDEEFKFEKLIELYLVDEKNIDDVFTEFIEEHLNSKIYNNIFIPLCFGKTLSDYLGLRFACHIRCTPNINQNINIYLYSFTGIKDLFSNDCFNIIKTKGVFFIDYDVNTILKYCNEEKTYLSKDNIINEIKKLNLQIPANYEDNHSITNEWAIYRWSHSIDANDDGIAKITGIQNSNLYFKYLRTIYPVGHLDKFDSKLLKINFEGHPKVLYIDDEADKGWYEIFCNILCDNNKINFDYLDDEFNGKSKDEIIDISIKKIIDEDIDIVILDFRLHKEDFDNNNVKEVTGYQILKKIKECNKGIQVIIFSATNKIWNLQALQEAGVDGFIIKESPENSIDVNFTNQSINNFLFTFNKCLNKLFIKDFYQKLDVLKNELIPRKNFKTSKNPLPKEFVDESIKWLELSYDTLSDGLSDERQTASFLFMFSVLENISNRIIDVENPIAVNNKPGMFKFEFRLNSKRLRRFQEDENNPGFYRKTKGLLESKRNIPWIFKILNTLDFISDEKISDEELNSLIKKRNQIIHANSTMGDIINIDSNIIKFLNSIIYTGLINIK